MEEAERDCWEDSGATGGEDEDGEEERYPAEEDETLEELAATAEGRLGTRLEAGARLVF